MITSSTPLVSLPPQKVLICRRPHLQCNFNFGINVKFVRIQNKRGGNFRCKLAARVSQAVIGRTKDEVSPFRKLESVLVVGATGGVGQLVVVKLLERGLKIHALVRDSIKAELLFGKHAKLQVCTGDTRNPEDFRESIFEGVTHVICCTGTTAFPSKRWDGDNTPEKTDWEGVRNLVSALPSSIKRFVLVSSVGVTKSNQLPWSIMNLFGVLKFKKMGEDFLRSSGLPFTIIRPGRLMDGPYTSYDLNTLLKATAGTRRAVVIGKEDWWTNYGVETKALKDVAIRIVSQPCSASGDRLVGEASRHDVAEACIQALNLDCTLGETYEINSVNGTGPGTDPQKWRKLFEDANIRVSM